MYKSKSTLFLAHFYKFGKCETSHIFTIKYIITKWHANFVINTLFFTTIIVHSFIMIRICNRIPDYLLNVKKEKIASARFYKYFKAIWLICFIQILFIYKWDARNTLTFLAYDITIPMSFLSNSNVFFIEIIYSYFKSSLILSNICNC